MAMKEKLKKIVGKEAYRIGGDEFVAICPGIEEKELNQRNLLLRQRAAEEEINISIGISWRDENVHIKEQLYEADQRMYEEKKKYYMKEKTKTLSE